MVIRSESRIPGHEACAINRRSLIRITPTDPNSTVDLIVNGIMYGGGKAGNVGIKDGDGTKPIVISAKIMRNSTFNTYTFGVTDNTTNTTNNDGKTTITGNVVEGVLQGTNVAGNLPGPEFILTVARPPRSSATTPDPRDA